MYFLKIYALFEDTKSPKATVGISTLLRNIFVDVCNIQYVIEIGENSMDDFPWRFYKFSDKNFSDEFVECF